MKPPNSFVCVSQQPREIIIIFRDRVPKVELLGIKEYISKILVGTASSALKRQSHL